MVDITSDFPEIIESSITMEEANSPIQIYEGEFSLVSEEAEIKVDGKIYFKWFVDSGAYYSGTPQMKLRGFLPIYNTIKKFQLKIKGLDFGEVYITHFNTSSDTDVVFIKGVLRHKAILGDKSISVNKVIFSLPNFKDIIGLPVKKTSNGYTSSNARLIFENENYLICIDKCIDYNKKVESLEEKGGYNILYYGELTPKKDSLKYDNIEGITHCFGTFLTFVNGRRTTPLFRQGIFDSEVIWTDYTDYIIDKYSPARSWSSKKHINGLNEVWERFSFLWKDENHRNFLESAIHWYTEANNSLFFENSIIISQTALELLYNWWIVEQKKMIIGRDSENITAANKIRLILSQLNISCDAPSTFTHLKQFIKDNKEILDAPDAIVQIRNAVVHSQEEKRKKIDSIPYKVKNEALQLSIWYIEMTLLCIFNFNEVYNCRLNYMCRSEMYVPWKTTKCQPE